MKFRQFLFVLVITFLMVSCDGSVLVEVVTAEDSPNNNYQKILGIYDSRVYYQNNKGLFSNISGGTDETTLVANSKGHLVQYSCLVECSGNYYILFFSTDPDSNDGYRQTIGVYDIANSTPFECTLELSNDSTSYSGVSGKGYWIKGVHEDGSLVVSDSSANKAYVCYLDAIDTANKKVSFIFSDSYGQVIDLADSGSLKYNVGSYYVQGNNSTTYAMLTKVQKDSDEDSDEDFAADLYFYKLDSGIPKLYAVSSSTNTLPYRAANFAINSDGTVAYVLCTNGRLYRYSLDSSTKTATNQGYRSTGYSYGNGCLMYYVSYGSKDYLITKPNYKSRAIITLETDASFSYLDDNSLRKGFAQRLDSDLVNCFYEVSSDSTNSKSNLLVGTNGSGMVSVTINWGSVTSNSSSNGSSSVAEQYEFSVT